MNRPRTGFSLVELVMVIVVLAVIGLFLAPMMKQRWNADGQSNSVNNVRQILQANEQYRWDHANRVPMRGSRYQNGQIQGGWDTWHVAGKNCSSFWAGGAFDEHAYNRFLNPYLQDALPPMPVGYSNTGSGATWNFNQGTITALQRTSFRVKVCRSPGDIATRQRNWPVATPGVSCYDDVGSSYHVNMNWWDIPGGPSNFTAKFDAGTRAISKLPRRLVTRLPSNFVWLTDQIGTLAVWTTTTTPGEFGGANMSVVGFLDGRASYMQLSAGAMSGPGYTFAITWP